MSSLEKFISIKSIVDSLSSATKIIVVTKNFNFEQIKSIIDFGHTEFGENKVQEAKYKWNDYLINSPINLHLIGILQSNKSKEAVQIFNYIHSLDSLKLAKELSKNEKILNKKVKYFVQINIANEKQKLEVSGLWGNVQQPNGRHRVHSHPNNYFSFCYYVQTGGDDYLTFHDFRPEHIIPKIKTLNDHTASNFMEKVYPKKLLMWPSWVKHEVVENPNYRVSMGGNIRIPKVLEAGSHGCMAQ